MHLKRISMPKTWPLPRKEKTFVSPGTGPISRELSLPLLGVLRDLLAVAHT